MPTSSTAGFGTLAALLVFIAASVWLGTLAHRAIERGSFLKGYFLGNRGLGAWAVALTATVQSGGTFMGFPSLVYSYGWIVALWIAGYMVVPITAFGVLGKRLAQISRRTGAITVPDLFRERFGSPALGLTASLFILFFLSFMMVAQFKAGAVVMEIAWPGSDPATVGTGDLSETYYIGLAVFTLTVVGYTLIGGFLAAVWTDLFQSVMMLLGVVLLLVLALNATGGIEQATQTAVENLHRIHVAIPPTVGGIAATQGREFLRPADLYAFGPGYAPPGALADWAFHPLGLAFSFFFVWVFAGLASPASMVRVMACKDTGTLRRSIFVLSIYNALIYIPLVIICIAARAVMPDVAHSDRAVPLMAMAMTRDLFGGSLWAGLIMAAPFGAVMATVSSYLVVIASGLVRDVYQRFLRPEASQKELRRLSYAAMVVVGAIALAANIRPVQYLQAVVVFSGTSAASTFVTPALMTAFWRRATAKGALAAMLAGAGSTLALYIAGWRTGASLMGEQTSFSPYYLFGLHPIVWGLAVSFFAGVTVSLFTTPPDAERVALLFDAPAPRPAPAPATLASSLDLARRSKSRSGFS